jgi:hypothetical protein
MLFAVVLFLESLLSAGAFLVALTLAIPVTLLTIAVAWIVQRPVVGVALPAGAVVAWYLLRQPLPKRATRRTPEPRGVEMRAGILMPGGKRLGGCGNV